MGNNIGLEVDNDSVKLAYVEDNQSHVEFFRNLKSKYLIDEFKWQQSTAFLLQCSIPQFLAYPTSGNVNLLQNQYKQLLAGEKLTIKTNRETISRISRNIKLQEALEAILRRSFQTSHKQRIELTVQSLNLLQQNQPFYNFSTLFQLTELHHHFDNLKTQKKQMPTSSLLVMLRNGTTIYRVEKGQKLQRIGGSIIGETTINNIFRFKFPHRTISQVFQMAMNLGNLKNVDMMVEDIYGKNTSKLGLPADIIASSLGKIGKMSPEELSSQKDQDIARSLITSFAINIANLTAISLKQTNVDSAIILADFFHHHRFYCLVQSILAIFAPGKHIIFSEHSPFISCLGSALER